MARKVDKTVKLCVICGDKAKGVNFNVLTCMSCKAFFRRNALRKKEMKCPFNDNCQIDKITRKFCSKCRLKKCFESGMKKEWILSDEEKQLIKEKIIRNKLRKQQQELERQNGCSAFGGIVDGTKSGRTNGRRNNNSAKIFSEKCIKDKEIAKGNGFDPQAATLGKGSMGNDNFNCCDISVKYQADANGSFFPMMCPTVNTNQQSRLSSLNNVNNSHINEEFIFSQLGSFEASTAPILNSDTSKYISLSNNAAPTSRICHHFTEPSAFSLDTLLTSNESDIFLDNESTSSLSFNVNNHHHYHNYVNNNHYDYVPQIHGSLTNFSTSDDPNDDELFSSYIHHSIKHSNHQHHYHHSILDDNNTNNISMNNNDNNNNNNNEDNNINLNMNVNQMENIFNDNNNDDDNAMASNLNGIIDYNYKYNNDELIIASPFGINDLDLDVGLRFGSSSISSSLSDCCFLFSTNNSIDSIDFFNNPELENLELNNNNNNNNNNDNNIDNDNVCGSKIGIKDIDPLLNNGKKNAAIIIAGNNTTTTGAAAAINADSNTIIDDNNNNNAGNQSSIINVDCKSSITNIDGNNNNEKNSINNADGFLSNGNNDKDIRQQEFKFLTDYLSRTNGTNASENKSVKMEDEKAIRMEGRNEMDSLNSSSNLLNASEKDGIDEESSLVSNMVNENDIVNMANGDNENSLANDDKITIESDKIIIINNDDDETNNAVEDFSQYLLHDNDPPLTFQQQQNVEPSSQLDAVVMNTILSTLAASSSSSSLPPSSSSSSSSSPLSTTAADQIMDTTGLANSEMANSFPFIPTSLSPTVSAKLLPTAPRFSLNRNASNNNNHFKHQQQSIESAAPKVTASLKDVKKTPLTVHGTPKNLLSIFNETELMGGIKNGIDYFNERLDNNNNCPGDQSSSILPTTTSSVDLDQIDPIVNENINNKIRNNNNNCEYLSRSIAIANNELILPERCLIQELSLACSLLKNPYKRTIYVTSIYQHSHNCKISEFFLHRLIRMSKRLSSFSSLLLDDQIQLLKQGLIEMLCLRSVLLYDPDREAFNFLDDKCKLSILVDIELIKPTHIYLNCELKNFPQRFMHEWKTDDIIFNLMTAIILFTPRPELREKDRIKEEYLRYKYLLRRYLEIKYNNRMEAINTFSLLMLRIEEVRLLNLDITQMLINQHQLSSSPLFVQLLNLDNQKFAPNHNINNNNNNNNNNSNNVFNDLDNKASNNGPNTSILASNDNVKMESNNNGNGNNMAANNINHYHHHHHHHPHHHHHHHQTIHQY